MNARLMLPLLACCSLAASATAIQLGDAPAAVRAELGEPAGQLQIGARILYTYDRGAVEFWSNAVTRIELVSAEEAAARRAADALARERQRQWSLAQREARMAAGQEALTRARADATLPARSAAEQVAFWRGFQVSYPETPVEVELAAALRRLEIESIERRLADAEARRVSDLERQLAAAEDRARDAERRSLNRTFDYTGYGYSYPVVYPVYYARPYSYCPPRREPPREEVRRGTGVTITFGNAASYSVNSCDLVRGNNQLVRH